MLVNASLLKRLFRAIGEASNEDVYRVCRAIIKDARDKKHHILADELEALLTEAQARPLEVVAKPVNTALAAIPQNTQKFGSIVSIVNRDLLEHHIVLAKPIENRFMRIENEYAARERLALHGLRPRKKILLYGPPGCGKTLGAKRLAWSTGLTLVRVRFDVMLSSLFGESASNLRAIFEFCAQNPSLLLLDECDFIARSRTNQKDIGEVHRIVNSLLQLLDEYDLPGLLVATTNIHDQIDSALFRRFDEVVEITKPGPDEVLAILKMALSSVNLDKKINWKEVVSCLSNKSASDVVRVAENASKDVILSGGKTLTESNLKKAIRDLEF